MAQSLALEGSMQSTRAILSPLVVRRRTDEARALPIHAQRDTHLPRGPSMSITISSVGFVLSIMAHGQEPVLGNL